MKRQIFRKKVLMLIIREAHKKGKILKYHTFLNIYTSAIASYRAFLYIGSEYIEAVVMMEGTIERELNELAYLSFLGIKKEN